MIVATRNTASVELAHARRGTANPPVHTEHALNPGSSLVGAGLGAERCQPTWVGRWRPSAATISGGSRFLHLRGAGDLVGSPPFPSLGAAGSFSTHPDERLTHIRPRP